MEAKAGKATARPVFWGGKKTPRCECNSFPYISNNKKLEINTPPGTSFIREFLRSQLAKLGFQPPNQSVVLTHMTHSSIVFVTTAVFYKIMMENVDEKQKFPTRTYEVVVTFCILAPFFFVLVVL